MKQFLPSSADSAKSTVNRRILEIFRDREGGLVSGEEISGVLGISRTAVWKHIKSLRALGYSVVAVPSRGYRIVSSPDLLVPDDISSSIVVDRIGGRIICLRETESTNIVAFRLAEEGAEEGTVVIADAQTQGKGRMGRRWESPAGTNLYCSVIVRPPISPMQAAQLTLCSVVAVARAVEKATTLIPSIKWPNDVLINGKKVAGLLNEMSAETDKVNFVILGIGININMTAEQFSADLRHPATSLLLESGKKIDRRAVACSLLESLDELYSLFLSRGHQPIRDEWLSRTNVLNRRVSVSSHDTAVCGIVTGIDEYGALLLQCDDGRMEKILAGDVTILSANG